MTGRPLASAVTAWIAVAAMATLAGCTPDPTPEPAPSPIVSPSEGAIVGEWESETTDDTILRVAADGTFSVSGFCAVSGTWEADGPIVVAAALSIPDIGGCPETFDVDRRTLSSIVVQSDGTIQLVDDHDRRDMFRKRE